MSMRRKCSAASRRVSVPLAALRAGTSPSSRKSTFARVLRDARRTVQRLEHAALKDGFDHLAHASGLSANPETSIIPPWTKGNKTARRRRHVADRLWKASP